MGSSPLALLAAALAGVTTLATEVLWIRGLGRAVGTTQEAAAVIVGLVLGSLGWGAWAGGRAAPAAPRPARSAAWSLLVAGAWAALSPALLSFAGGADTGILDAIGAQGDGGPLPTLLIALVVVAPAGYALGRAFPLLVRCRDAGPRRAGSSTGGVYAWNTAGGVLGVATALFVLDTGGESLALRVAGGCGLAGALLLLWADRPAGVDPAPSSQPPPAPETTGPRVAPVVLLSGAVALLSQMAWLRLLQPLAGAHVFGAALLIAPVLVAITAGAALGGWIADHLPRPRLLLPLLLFAGGGCLLLSLPTAGRAPYWVATCGSDTWERVLVLLGSFAVATMPATLCLAALLPAAVRVSATRDGGAARAAGNLFAVNALGAVLGSTIAGLGLLPAWGTERTLLAGALLSLAGAVWLAWRLGGRRRIPATLLCAAPLLVLAAPGVLGGWLHAGPSVPELIVAGKPLPPGMSLEPGPGFALYASIWGGRRAERIGVDGARRMPLYEGRGGRIALIEEPSGVVGIRRGTLRESAFDPDRPDVPLPTEYALGLLPALLAGQPRRALVIGHGAGWTAEAVLAACKARLDVAEIDPAVLDAARAWRGLDALPAESSPRARIVPTDGRVLLRRASDLPSGERYDVIASQPSHPWSPSSGHLFTVEAYAAARKALDDGGVLAQWLNLFDMTPNLLARAVASFRTVFPAMWVFRFPDELVLVGFRGKAALDTARWERFFDPTSARSKGARLAGFTSAGDLWKHLLLDAPGVARVVPDGSPTLHDDLPELELGLAWRRFARAPPTDAPAVLERGFPPSVDAMIPDAKVRDRWLAQAVEGWLDDGAPGLAYRWSSAAQWGGSAHARLVRARAAAAAGHGDQAEGLLRGARAEWPTRGDLAAAWIGAAKERLAAMDRRERFELSREVEGLVEGAFAQDGRVLLAAAQYRRALGEGERAGTLFERALAATGHPAPPGTGVQFARLLLTGDYARDTERRAIELLAADEETFRNIDALDLLLRLTSASGQERRAREFEKALGTLEQTRGLALVREARAYLAQHRFPEAARAADAARHIWAMQPAAQEEFGLTALAATADARSGTPATDYTVEDAIAAFDTALELDAHPARRRARIRTILGWYGVSPDRLRAPR